MSGDDVLDVGCVQPRGRHDSLRVAMLVREPLEPLGLHDGLLRVPARLDVDRADHVLLARVRKVVAQAIAVSERADVTGHHLGWAARSSARDRDFAPGPRGGDARRRRVGLAGSRGEVASAVRVDDEYRSRAVHRPPGTAPAFWSCAASLDGPSKPRSAVPTDRQRCRRGTAVAGSGYQALARRSAADGVVTCPIPSGSRTPGAPGAVTGKSSARHPRGRGSYGQG